MAVAQLLGSSGVVLRRMYFGFREVAKEIMMVRGTMEGIQLIIATIIHPHSRAWYEALWTRASMQYIINQSQQEQGAKSVNLRLLRARQGTEMLQAIMHVQSS